MKPAAWVWVCGGSLTVDPDPYPHHPHPCTHVGIQTRDIHYLQKMDRQAQSPYFTRLSLAKDRVMKLMAERES